MKEGGAGRRNFVADDELVLVLTLVLTLLEPQSRFGDKPFKDQVVCPQNGTAVLKGLNSVGDIFAARNKRGELFFFSEKKEEERNN